MSRAEVKYGSYLDATAGDRYRIFTGIPESRSFLIP